MKLKIKVKSGFGQPAQESKNVVDMLREAIEAENDAATQYEQYARLTTDKQAKKLFLDIAGDEKQHFGQLTNFLEYVDPSFKKRFDDGINENKSLKVEAITPILKQVSELQNAEDGNVDVNDTLENNEELELKEHIEDGIDYDETAEGKALTEDDVLIHEDLEDGYSEEDEEMLDEEDEESDELFDTDDLDDDDSIYDNDEDIIE